MLRAGPSCSCRAAVSQSRSARAPQQAGEGGGRDSQPYSARASVRGAPASRSDMTTLRVEPLAMFGSNRGAPRVQEAGSRTQSPETPHPPLWSVIRPLRRCLSRPVLQACHLGFRPGCAAARPFLAVSQADQVRPPVAPAEGVSSVPSAMRMRASRAKRRASCCPKR